MNPWVTQPRSLQAALLYGCNVFPKIALAGLDAPGFSELQLGRGSVSLGVGALASAASG
jgi:hypothetical protein